MTVKKQKDDLFNVKCFTDVDDCEIIKKIMNLEIELIADDNYKEEKNIPDWYGYMRIDKK